MVDGLFFLGISLQINNVQDIAECTLIIAAKLRLKLTFILQFASLGYTYLTHQPPSFNLSSTNAALKVAARGIWTTLPSSSSIDAWLFDPMKQTYSNIVLEVYGLPSMVSWVVYNFSVKGKKALHFLLRLKMTEFCKEGDAVKLEGFLSHTEKANTLPLHE